MTVLDMNGVVHMVTDVLVIQNVTKTIITTTTTTIIIIIMIRHQTKEATTTR